MQLNFFQGLTEKLFFVILTVRVFADIIKQRELL